MPEDLALDETIEETFPASDAPANTVAIGIRTGAAPTASPTVRDNVARQRFEAEVDGQTAFLAYDRTAETLTLIHTEVPRELRGLRLGDALVRRAVSDARARGLRPIADCPFARVWFRKHLSHA
jgi:predicted GNAT family acetyltransferase